MTSNVGRHIAGVLLIVSVIVSLSSAQDSAAKRYFPDLQVVDQHGKSHRFYSDLVAGRVVIITSFSDTCADGCSTTGRNLVAIQERLGERFGKDAVILSITLNPETDTPEKMQEYATRSKARAGWFFLTGTKENIDYTLYKLGQYVQKPEDHKHVLIVGNPTTGLWKKALGDAKTTDVLAIVNSVLNDSDTKK